MSPEDVRKRKQVRDPLLSLLLVVVLLLLLLLWCSRRVAALRVVFGCAVAANRCDGRNCGVCIAHEVHIAPTASLLPPL
jgi:hypothetical protein